MSSTNDLTYSKSALALTERFEGCRLSSYQDSVGVWTIGYGHTASVRAEQTITQLQAEHFLVDDLLNAESTVRLFVTVALTQGEFDALIDFVFNVGRRAFFLSTLLKRLNAGDYVDAATELLRWDQAGGVELAGLLARRQAEAQEFTTPATDAPAGAPE